MKFPKENTIHFWIVDSQKLDSAEWQNQYLGWLSTHEQARYERYTALEAKREYLMARALVRSVLSIYSPQIEPASWEFESGTHGKPYITSPTLPVKLRFNLSHMEGLVCLVVTTHCDIGIDIESSNRVGMTLDLARHYFTQHEQDHLSGLADVQRSHRIAQLWALKESFLKASGVGIGVGHGLRKVAYSFQDEQGLSVKLDPSIAEIAETPQSWLFEYGQENHYKIAITALTSQPYLIQTFKIIPGVEYDALDLKSVRDTRSVVNHCGSKHDSIQS